MSVIAHWIEQRGISTVVIGLVRLHLEKTTPPRALWVPFELGRPLGAPGDAEFQKNVLHQALQLIENATTAGEIVDFAHDDPRANPDPDWQAPDIDSAQNILTEVEALKPYYQRQCVDNSRTAVGVAKIPIKEAAQLFDATYNNEEFVCSREDASAIMMLRLAIDDLKSYYIEAALIEGTPSSRQIYDWLWEETLLGKQIRQLRKKSSQSDDPKLAKLGAKFIVPHRWRD